MSDLSKLETYRETLGETLKTLRGEPDHSNPFLEALGLDMSIKGLETSDIILLPSDDKQHAAILRIVEADLDRIRNLPKDNSKETSEWRPKTFRPATTAQSSKKTSKIEAREAFKRKYMQGGSRSQMRKERTEVPFRDLGPIAVLVEELNDEGRKSGVTKDELKAFVELKLRQSGIPVMKMEDNMVTLESPLVYVNVHPIYTESIDSFVYNIDIRLMQRVP